MALSSEAVHTTSFDFVFAAHHSYIYRVAHTLLGNAQDAEDVTQEVFLRLYKALPKYDPERANMRTWLTKITVNVCKTHRRRNFFSNLWKSTWPEEDDNNDFEPADMSLLGAPEDQALQNDLRKVVQDVLAKLRPEHRTVLVLHYYMDLSCPEIAAVMECPEGTVYSRLHYARRLVQTHLERQAKRSGSEVEL